MTRLNGKTALVTGGGSSIGRAASVMFAAQGAEIVVADFNLDAAIEAVAAIEATGGKAIAVSADVSDEAKVDAMVSEGVKTFGKIDILLSNS